MKLTTNHLKELAEIAIEAATTTGKFISKTRPLNVQQKEGGDSLASQVLTEVDGQSQDMILNILEPTFTQFDLALLTEESEDDGSRLIKDYFWCIDPIDGTLPFIEGVPGYAVSIALVSRAGIPQIGVVYDPVEHVLYHAIKDQGAFRNHIPWTIQNSGSTLFMNTDRSFAEQPEYPAVLSALENFGYSTVKTTTQGGGVMNAIWALKNAPACYFKFPKEKKGGGSFWDFAATTCIFHELGAIASDIHGAALQLNRKDSLFMNREGTLFATDHNLAQQIIALYKTLKQPTDHK